MHLKLKIPGNFNYDPEVPFPWGSRYWPVSFSSDEALQIAGLFHQGQFPYYSGYEARRVQHFPDFNFESIFITKNIFIMKNPTDFGFEFFLKMFCHLDSCPDMPWSRQVV